MLSALQGNAIIGHLHGISHPQFLVSDWSMEQIPLHKPRLLLQLVMLPDSVPGEGALRAQPAQTRVSGVSGGGQPVRSWTCNRAHVYGGLSMVTSLWDSSYLRQTSKSRLTWSTQSTRRTLRWTGTWSNTLQLQGVNEALQPKWSAALTCAVKPTADVLVALTCLKPP